MTQDKQILECEKKLINAMLYSDINVLDSILHDDLIFNIPTGQTISKSMDIENYKSGIMKVSEIVATDQIITSIDEVSIVAVTIHLKASYGEQTIDGSYRYLRVWKLFNDSYKVIAGSGFTI